MRRDAATSTAMDGKENGRTQKPQSMCNRVRTHARQYTVKELGCSKVDMGRQRQRWMLLGCYDHGRYVPKLQLKLGLALSLSAPSKILLFIVDRFCSRVGREDTRYVDRNR